MNAEVRKVIDMLMEHGAAIENEALQGSASPI